MKTIEQPGGIPVFISFQENRCYENLLERKCKDDLNERDLLTELRKLREKVENSFVDN